jgi:hypothetical protein
MSLVSFSSIGNYVGVRPATNNLIYFYNFETAAVSGTTIKNLSNEQYDATLVGTNTINTTTFKNGAGSLKCSNTSNNVRKYAKLTTATNFHSIDNKMSICLKCNFSSSLTSNVPYTHAFQVLDNANALISCIEAFNPTGDQLILRFTTLSPGIELLIGTGLSLNTWYSVVVTKNGNLINVFLNGELTNTLDNGNNYPITTNALNRWVCGANINSTSIYDGFIDDLRIYQRVITNSEILELHNNTT